VRTVSISEIRKRLTELLAAVEAGEEIIIRRRDRAIARLVALDRTMSPFSGSQPASQRNPSPSTDHFSR